MAVEAAPLSFSVSFDPSVRKENATGRLVIYLRAMKGPLPSMQVPTDAFDEQDPQPIYSIEANGVAPGATMIVDDSAVAFPVKLSELPAGKYRAQAVLDMAHENSSWRREPGNLWSDAVAIDSAALKEPVRISLRHVVQEPKRATVASVEIVSIRSKLLSDFRRKDVYLNAGVALPLNYDPKRAYPAVYEIPGFGGDHTMAYFKSARRGHRPPGSMANEVARNTFWIFLDPESPNGHTLFADSDNNGPVGKALVSELIPALEMKFNLIPQASARIVTGHSSGGWSSLWLATEYPDVFGACWSSSPDPVDFRRMEKVNIYEDRNMYVDPKGGEFSSARFGGKSTMTVRQENGMEQVLGPNNDSAQQWDSWQAVWGHRAADGNIRPLYDAIEGTIDKAEAESYRRFDIGERLRRDPRRYVSIFRENIRLVCGTEDTYYLNEAVELLKTDLDKLDPPNAAEGRPGYIRLVPGDHQSVSNSSAMQNWANEMMQHLRQHGHVQPASPTTLPSTSRSG